MATGKKVKISISIDEGWLAKIDTVAEKQVRNRSQAIEMAVREYVLRNPLIDANNLPPAPGKAEKK